MDKMKSLFLSSLLVVVSTSGLAQNPIIQTNYTADPAPMVYNDKVYLYTTHDEDNSTWFTMNDWRLYTTSDMVNWTDHGAVLSYTDFSWAKGDAWAPQCIERDGKFYMYVPMISNINNRGAIGVAVADSPYGPFYDPLGKPLVQSEWGDIDPTVFIDDDGQAYLYWGNPNLYYVKLNEDMISLKGGVGKLEQTVESFGAPNPEKRVKGVKYKDTYTEGPWLHKREGKYYLLYAAGGVPEHIAYSMSDGPLGPWKYMGEIMPLQDTGSFTNHCGVIDYKGNSYFFYHTGKLPGGGGFGRSAAVEQFKYNADGTFPIINATREGVSPVGTLNPYERVEAETIAFSEGVKSEPNVKTGIYISEIHNGDYIKVREVDFGNKSPKRFTATVASALRGGTLEVRTDSISGPLIAELTIPSTGGWECWKTLQADIVKPVTGIQDIYFVFKGRKGCKLFNFDWYKFNR